MNSNSCYIILYGSEVKNTSVQMQKGIVLVRGYDWLNPARSHCKTQSKLLHLLHLYYSNYQLYNYIIVDTLSLH